MKTNETLKGLYSFPGFKALQQIKPHWKDPDARIVTLKRRQKKVPVPVANISNWDIMTAGGIASGTYPVPAHGFMLSLSTAVSSVGGADP
jgi:hypothetical protein